MRKLFSQKSKHKTLTGSSIIMPLSSFNKDNEIPTTIPQANSAPSRIQNVTTSQNEIKLTTNDPMLSKIPTNNSIKQADIEEKSKKLFVVVSDADSTSTPTVSTERTDCRLLSVDDCETNESTTALPSRQRSSTSSIHHGERNSRKTTEEQRLRRRSWVVFQSNNCPSSDLVAQNQQTINLSRLRRFRLGQSEPNLSSLQMNSCYQTSPSVKTSPRTSSVAAHNTFQFLSRRSSTRRPNLSGLNLINLKYALRKQLSPQQSNTCATVSEPTHDLNTLDDNMNRRWSLTSAPSSSGYGTTSPSSSSQYSSFERLQHQQYMCTCKQQTDNNPHDDLQRLESRSISMSLLDANISSSPGKMMIMPDQDINTMAYIYKERYPKAKVQMEEGLQSFIDIYKLIDKFDYCSDGSARFIHNQIVELGKDCLEKSRNDLITTTYFNEMTNNLERLLLNTKEKCPQAIENLQTVVRKLLLTTARSARLLECLQFNPEDFLRTLDEVECQARTIANIKLDIPKYICSKLNLERNPLDVIDAVEDSESNNIEQNIPLSESENESLTDSNYLTITPNSTFPPLDRSLSAKGPCEEDFEILKLISNGAYGAVHLVKHRQTQERYAVKKISKSHLILLNQIEQAFVERDIMTFTDNPFVVALICTFETKNHLCLVMEYVEGGDVATLLKNIGGPLNIDIARMYFAETTLAVEYLHSYGIIHRDLKPDNLLITAVGHIKLTDFGLSKIGLMSLTTNFYEKHIDKETKTFNDKQICGTPSYIAPEVILRQGYGKPADWWSMGIILYEFLVGIPPFTGNTPDELFANVIHGEIDWDQLISDIYEDPSEQVFCSDAKNLIEQLLEHDPSRRLGSLGGAFEIRTHSFCSCINWNTLLREKADFVPVLESPDDTSYFDTRQDRYKHSDEDNLSSTATNNDSNPLFASFSSVSLKYVSELSGNHKQRHHSNKQENDSASSTDVSRANSCTDSSSANNIIHIDSPSDFQPLVITDETNDKVESSSIQPTFGSDTFEPLLVSSDESESSSKTEVFSSSSSQHVLSKIINPTKHYKQRKTSLKLLEQQSSIDSGDDNQQEKDIYRSHKKTRIPRALSPLQLNQSLPLPTQPNLTTPIVSISNEDFQQTSSSHSKPVKYNNQQRSFLRSFSSSSSPPPIWLNNQDDRSYRQTHRHNMAVSPLERDTTLKAQQQDLSSSSAISPIHSMTNNLRPPIIIRRGPRSFGFTLRAVKVFHGNTDYYTTQHVVVAVEGPAEEAGLKVNDVITHVNERPVAGLFHPEVVKLILSGSQKLSIRSVPCSETQIRTGGRRRSPSKQKIRYQQQSDRKISTHNDHHHHHQLSCQKHRTNSSGNNIGNNSNKKHQHNNSLFRRLSERKVARDMEAAVAAGVSLTIPTTCINTNNNNNNNPLTTTNANVLSSSLPLLSFNQLINDNNERALSSLPTQLSSAVKHHHHHTSTLDPSEWPPLKPSLPSTTEPDLPQPTLLPSIVKQKSQTSISPLAKCPLSASSSTSSFNPSVHQSLSKTLSEPAHVDRHDSTSSNHLQFPSRGNHYEQNYFYPPMISSHKKKLVRQKALYGPPLQSLFTLENNLNRNTQPYYQNPLSRSLSTESSTSSSPRFKNVDHSSSNPVVVPTKFFYRRR